MKFPGKIHCYLGCEGIGTYPRYYSYLVGCEIESVCDPELDEQTFMKLLGPDVRSIVRKQPTISELVNKAARNGDPKTDISKRGPSDSGQEIGMDDPSGTALT